jgi:hypothetical protein
MGMVCGWYGGLSIMFMFLGWGREGGKEGINIVCAVCVCVIVNGDALC